MRHVATSMIFALALCAAPASAETVSAQSGPVNVESLAKLDNPWGMTWLPDGGLLITEKPGRLRIFKDGKLSEPIAGVPEVAYGGQGGLLDVEIDPKFAANRFVYLSYTEPAQPGGGPNELKGGAVARAKLEGDRLSGLTVIWRQVPKIVGRGHFGGRLVFAPDGTLFITSGERQSFDPAQDRMSNLGKIVRINPDGSIPKNNPCVGRTDIRDDIWTMGHRNPLGAAYEGGRLWVHEMGPRGGDELNLIQPGRNYGYPIVSNGDHYDGRDIPDHSTRPEFEAPVRWWNPVISPSGLAFYKGTLFPGWRGNALIGGLSSQALIRLSMNGVRVAGEERIDMGRRIRDVIEAQDGALLLLSDGGNGELLRLTPARQAS